MEAKVDWKGRLTFTGTADFGFSVQLGAKAAVGGDDDGFRPMELIAMGLAGCTAMDVISILRKKRQDVTEFEVQVHVERAEEHPKVFTEAGDRLFYYWSRCGRNRCAASDWAIGASLLPGSGDV